MKVEFEYNLEQRCEVTKQRLKTLPTPKKIYKLGFCFGPLLGVLLWKLGVVRIEINSNRLIFLELLETVILGSALWAFIWFLLCHWFKNSWIAGMYAAEAKIKQLCGTCSIEITENGVAWKNPLAEYYLKWAAFKKVYDIKDFLIFEPISDTFLWVPKDAFQNKEKTDAFLQHAVELFEQNK